MVANVKHYIFAPGNFREFVDFVKIAPARENFLFYSIMIE